MAVSILHVADAGPRVGYQIAICPWAAICLAVPNTGIEEGLFVTDIAFRNDLSSALVNAGNNNVADPFGAGNAWGTGLGSLSTGPASALEQDAAALQGFIVNDSSLETVARVGYQKL